jgi:quinoprotein glucose dehydrogenase
MEPAMRRPRTVLRSLLLVPVLAGLARGQDKSYLPSVASASSEPEKARQSIRRPDDVAVTLFAAEPRLANPVAFSFDSKGRCYVVETFRLNDGVTDDRAHMYWLDDDLASRTVADREALLRKWLGKDVGTYAVEHDRIRLIEDRDGDGKADLDSVFADGFNQLTSGLASGVLATKHGVYFANIPDLWLLKDTKGAGKADERTVLSTGYGVHVSFIGHDLHGLIMGPDGRLYFTIGDRGLHVVTKDGKTVSCPDTGAVLRCEPDGSNLEIFATGLRNPQELAFDDAGNLFTVDNNSDSGDKARVVHVVEGGDSGWRIGYQYLERPASRGPWNAEKLWYPAPENTGAYIIPPLLNLADGPSGFTFDPGVTLLPDRYKGRFFLADFRGGSGQSGVRSFGLAPDGASFKVVDSQQPFWSVLATDVDFGPDGALYVSDWVDGWNKTGKGRIWRFADPKKEGSKAVEEVQKLLAEGMTARPVEELATLLGHADRRVRQAAQFDLADRAIAESRARISSNYDPRFSSREAQSALTRVAKEGPNRLARRHALWALGQLDRKLAIAWGTIGSLAGDKDVEVRAQVARLLGSVVPKPGTGDLDTVRHSLLTLLSDTDPRVRSLAAQSLGKFASSRDVALYFRILRENSDRDPYLRHAAVTGLARIGDPASLKAAVSDPDASVRLGAALALRRISPETLSAFLADADPRIVLEAARGIYDDEPASGPAMAALAGMARATKLAGPLLRRVVNANARLGGNSRAEALASVAARREEPSSARAEALELLGDWGKPSGRDRLTGLWRPYPARPRDEAVKAVKAHLDDLMATDSEGVKRASIGAIGNLGVAEAVPALVLVAGDAKSQGSTRIEALRALEKIGDPRLTDAVTAAIEASDSRVRVEAQRLLAKSSPEKAVPMLAKVLAKGSVREKQGAVGVLAELRRPEADAMLADHLRAADLPPEVELDLLEAAAKRSGVAEVKAALAAAEAKAGVDPLAEYRAIRVGGDSAKGRAIFQNNSAVYCVRCHKVRGQGGEVGPDLTGIGGKQSRDYLATSLVHPNAAIAQGFETVVVSLADGRVISGVFKSEDDKTLRLVSVEGKPIEVAKSEIEERKRGPSAMPDDLARKLTKTELRDLVEFLASQR